MIKVQRKINFINDCEAIFDAAELEQAIIWYQDGPTLGIKHVYLFGQYPAVSIHRQKLHIHRLLMSYWLGTKIPAGFTVHHLDKNKLNASKDNLCVILSEKHQSIHNKNKVLSREHKEKLALRNHDRKGIGHRPSRPDVTPEMVTQLYVSGKTINQISKAFKIDWGCVKKRIHENPELLEVGHA